MEAGTKEPYFEKNDALLRPLAVEIFHQSGLAKKFCFLQPREEQKKENDISDVLQKIECREDVNFTEEQYNEIASAICLQRVEPTAKLFQALWQHYGAKDLCSLILHLPLVDEDVIVEALNLKEPFLLKCVLQLGPFSRVELIRSMAQKLEEGSMQWILRELTDWLRILFDVPQRCLGDLTRSIIGKDYGAAKQNKKRKKSFATVEEHNFNSAVANMFPSVRAVCEFLSVVLDSKVFALIGSDNCHTELQQLASLIGDACASRSNLTETIGSLSALLRLTPDETFGASNKERLVDIVKTVL